jgi:polysaccharide biosynthesis protein PelF
MRRILFVFAWLVVGGEETELRLLARNLDRNNYRIDVIPCFRKPNMPKQTHEQLQALGVQVDRTAYELSFEDTVAYLAARIPAYDVVVACQAVPDVYPAYERLIAQGITPPPLIEHGGLVEEALKGAKHLTARYVGVCASIRDAAVSRMGERGQHALEIPSMVDLSEFDTAHREAVRAEWGFGDDTPVIGWVGRLDRKKRVEDFICAAGLLSARCPEARYVIIGGADAFMPEYADELRALSNSLGLDDKLLFIGDRPDVARLLSGLDVLVWLSEGEGMPHVISEAGAARLAVVATRDNGAIEQIADGVTGLFVPHRAPDAVAAAFHKLIDQPELRRRLGQALREKVEREFSTGAIIPQWIALFEDVIAESRAALSPRP